VIVLDENIDQRQVLSRLKTIYRGEILSIRELRPGSLIPDEDIPRLLRSLQQPAFITTNVVDFWRKVDPHLGYCIICFPLATQRQREIPGLLALVFRHPQFRTKKQRAGKILRVAYGEILHYDRQKRVMRICLA
jgi:hypothetical protein